MENNINSVNYSHTGANHIKSKTIFSKTKVTKEDYTHTSWNHIRERDIEQVSESKEKKENRIISWVVDTLNPTNHFPIIGTIKKIHSKAAQSLDIVQSVAGGMIYGGPFGMLKGFGSWLVGKIINNRNSNPKPINVSKNPTNKQTFTRDNKEDINIKPKIEAYKNPDISYNISKPLFEKNTSLIKKENELNYKLNKDKILKFYSDSDNFREKTINTSA